ncbi:MAG: proline dehydrogenase family protein [Nitrospirota bacterium]
MLKRLLLALSDAAWARRIVARAPIARHMARRFVAGETLDDAVAAIRALNASRMGATVDCLGEHVRSSADAIRAADGYLAAIDRLAGERLDANVSLKLTQLGLDLDETVCLTQMRRILSRAGEHDMFVRIDMESSRYTEQTLAICRALNREFGRDRVGVVIQAYLHRSGQDLEALLAEGIRVRLCKGAYLEPPELASPRKSDVDANYVRLARRLMQSAAQGLYHAIATHDQRMIAAAIGEATRLSLPKDRFEFQMLYGIRRSLQRQLVADGYRVRIYVPYGTEWYPYLMRRLAERPANFWFFLTQLIRR